MDKVRKPSISEVNLCSCRKRKPDVWVIRLLPNIKPTELYKMRHMRLEETA
jgi:hypothetical protein